MSTLDLLKSSMSPFGRCNRVGMLRLTCALIAAQIVAALFIGLTGAGLQGTAAMFVKWGFLWLGFCVTSKRLHDIGLSAWWIPGAFAILIVWSFIQTFLLFWIMGMQMLDINGPAFWISIAGTVTPVLAATIWLHYAPGEKSANNHGPVPGSNGHSRPPKRNAAPATVNGF